MRRILAGGIALILIGLVAPACGDDTDVGDAGAKDGSAATDGTAQGDATSGDGSSGFDSGPAFDAGQHPEAGPQPYVACGDAGADGGDAGDPCFSSPPSKCLDDTWVAFYFNGTCVAGACQYQTSYYACEKPSEGNCVNGACEHPVLR